MRQLPLDFGHAPSYDPADFIKSPANERALEALFRWPQDLGHALLLIGPEGSGKSHLARSWQLHVGALSYEKDIDLALLPQGAVVVAEDIDRAAIGLEQIFHLYNWVREKKGRLLLTAQKKPQDWAGALPDLQSRLKAISLFEITLPDDGLMVLLLAKLFADRQLIVDPHILEWAVVRMERSYSAIHHLVAEADRLALAHKRAISWPLLRSIVHPETA